MRKIFAYLFLIVLLTSCIANTKMSLSSSYKDEFILNKSKKYLFIKNNLHTNDLSFIKTVDNDFKNIFGENLHIKNSLLEFENDRFVRVTNGFIDIMKETYSEDFDYLVIIRFVRKPENKDDLDNKFIKVCFSITKLVTLFQ